MFSLGKVRGRQVKGETKGSAFTDAQVLAAALVLVGGIFATVSTAIGASNSLAVEKAKAEAQLKLETEREKNTRAKEQRAQDHEIRMAYFSKAIDPALDDRERERVLRFLASSFADKDLREWATDELKGVQKTIAETERRWREAEAKRTVLEAELSSTRSALERADAEHREQLLNHKRQQEAAYRKQLDTKADSCAAFWRACTACRKNKGAGCVTLCWEWSRCDVDLELMRAVIAAPSRAP